VPSGLAGADVERLLDQAEVVSDLLSADDHANPGLRLGAAIAGTSPLRDKLVLLDAGSGLVGFAAWAEQLIAESTGKHGTGILPVVVDDVDSPEVTGGWDDVTVVDLLGDKDVEDLVTESSRVAVAGALGAQLLLWEVGTTVAGRLLGINPFDQPDVESAKQAARGLLSAPPTGADAAFTVDGIGVHVPGDDRWLGGAESVDQAVTALLEQVDHDRGYVAVMAYLDRWVHVDLEEVRDRLARRAGRPVTFGWGPRFLHSTGQLHKGGPPVGVFLQVTADPAQDLEVPGREFGFGTLIAAQAAGDAAVLAEQGRPVLRLHLEDVQSGVAALRELLGR
jgi:glucose-6-phosphate isomerase